MGVQGSAIRRNGLRAVVQTGVAVGLDAGRNLRKKCHSSWLCRAGMDLTSRCGCPRCWTQPARLGIGAWEVVKDGVRRQDQRRPAPHACRTACTCADVSPLHSTARLSSTSAPVAAPHPARPSLLYAYSPRATRLCPGYDFTDPNPRTHARLPDAFRTFAVRAAVQRTCARMSLIMSDDSAWPRPSMRSSRSSFTCGRDRQATRAAMAACHRNTLLCTRCPLAPATHDSFTARRMTHNA